VKRPVAKESEGLGENKVKVFAKLFAYIKIFS
jgi:hypothetical protein